MFPLTFLHNRARRTLELSPSDVNHCRMMIRFFLFVTGKPPPKVSWLVNDKLMPNTAETEEDGVIVNRLQVRSVTREMYNSSFKCQAGNSKKTRPLEKGIRLELYRESFIILLLLFRFIPFDSPERGQQGFFFQTT